MIENIVAFGMLLSAGLQAYAVDAPALFSQAQSYAERKNQQRQLLSAIEQGDVACVRTLLQQGVDKNACYNDWTPLGFATFLQNSAIVQLLLEHGADANGHMPGATPLAFAVLLGNAPLVATLLAHGANPNIVPNKVGGDVDTWPNMLFFVPIARPDIGELLIKHGCDINACTPAGVTSLHMNTRRLDIIACDLLVKHGACMNMQDADGNTPLHYALLRYPELKEKSYQHNDEQQQSLQLYLVNYCIIACFVRKGADMHIPNKNGKTAADLCAKYDIDVNKMMEIGNN